MRVRPLREWRTEKLLSVEVLAAKAGVTAKTLSLVERGLSTPAYRTMRRISDALEVDPLAVTEFVEAIEERQSKIAA